MIRLHGIAKELIAAKEMLGKRQRFPVLDTVSTFYKGLGEVKRLKKRRMQHQKKDDLPQSQTG